MLVVGLTGGLGSGKTTAANYFAKLGVPLIDADRIAHELTAAQTPCSQAIASYFGASILKPDGSLDREKLRQLIFSNPEKKAWLEELLHPLIIQEIKKKLSEIKAPYCLVIIPLLLETGPYSFIDRVLVVEAPEEKRLQRAQKRDGGTIEALQKIIEVQASPEKRAIEAQDLIHNQGSLEELEQQVLSLHHHYMSKL